MVAAARALDADDAEKVRSSRSEVEGDIGLPEGVLGPRRLRFRADRVDELAAGSRWTDYKTGAPLSFAQGAETRAKHLIAGIARGEKLQAMAYAIGSGASGSGRYAFLREDLEPHKRVFAIEAGNDLAREAFDQALERLVAALDMGVLFPRLLHADLHRTNGLCAGCEMAQACLRGDSGANRRLARFVSASGHASDAEEVALRLWALSSLKVDS
jgi:RecB family exonuclease